jgi:hypothetical protein
MADERRAQRADAREQRRSMTSKPFEELDEAAGREAESTPMAAAKRAAGTAVAAALAGALAGAAKAMHDRRAQHAEHENGEEGEKGEKRKKDQPRTEQGVDTPDDERQDVTSEAEPQEDAEPQAEDEPEPAEEEQQPEDEHDESSDNGTSGAPAGEAMQIVKRARAQLEELLGVEAESISGVQRSNGAWHVTLEAVEMRRIPDSTDILASYEVVLDDDGGVVSMERTRRYRRSQVEEG